MLDAPNYSQHKVILRVKLEATVHISVACIFLLSLLASLENLSQNRFQNSPLGPKENDKSEKKRLEVESRNSNQFTTGVSISTSIR